MKSSILLLPSLSLVALLATSTSAEASPVGVSLKAGTLGAGAELDYRFNENFNLRLQANTFNYKDDFEEDDINYSGKIDLSTAGILLDWRPFSGTFRLTGGYYINNNEIKANAKDASNEGYELGDVTYFSDTANPLSLNANMELGNSSSGYLGLGWGNATDAGWMFSFELGVLFAGSPKIDLSASGSAVVYIDGAANYFDVSDTTNPLVQEFNANLITEKNNLEKDISDFEFYPVITLGVGYRF
ncbi:hypothetical protein [Pseudoalteromonas tunicata]|jgi:hypothetical protein|uniref:Outer membrane protein domain-containing protein n=1 Tax=Pseudoalteromonas tunicata D2 TaxID=87626 RepID=A4C7R4_9GAMM|nr:hypothetical protein [Pseudoalteromonas tunicata]ATC93135.1 hypothetical protein PTUN_a0324 [Pseudoalteromonas tunicata]AXT32207.1 hypothetical protein D1819_16180 [Pseudoalteromonas tunicata]EAR28629.1 hypothetical protein PTD2_06294 [Pseudoalteromonas tunicata D2]MDP4985815.1 hypothetical protein [Pseudoalteromonas tunicata]MDP5212691.1 hypothetical protein [Pseudoalteromonas tunicata]